MYANLKRSALLGIESGAGIRFVELKTLKTYKRGQVLNGKGLANGKWNRRKKEVGIGR